MAKENQETVGERDELPPNDLGIEGEHYEGANDDVYYSESDDARLETSGELVDHTPGTFDEETEDRHVVSAPPSLAMWLSDELRPSPSKSTPPVAPVSIAPPETLAPVALPEAELSDEDLAVLPRGARPGASRSGLRAGLLLLLGAAAAVFLFSYARAPASAPQPMFTEAAAQPVAAPIDRGVPAAPAPAAETANPEETTADRPTQRAAHDRRLPLTVAEESALDEEARLRGPSVGRFPDLPPEYWSELRRRELESRAERWRQLAVETPAP